MNIAGNRDSFRYDMTVRGMSNRPAYQTKPNSTMYISTRKEGRSVTVMDGSKTGNESINKRREGDGMEGDGAALGGEMERYVCYLTKNMMNCHTSGRVWVHHRWFGSTKMARRIG